MKYLYGAALVASFALLSPATATAVPITSIPGLEGNGSFTGTVEYDPVLATLTLSLTNTSPALNGGFITAVAFNNPDDKITNVALASTDPDFGLLGASPFQNGIGVSPFGDADIGASVGGGWLGMGSPNPGIGVGGSATFTFMLTGVGLNLVTLNNFGTALSTGGGEDGRWLLVRFRGFENGGSDKVAAIVPGTPTQQSAVPEPGTWMLLGSGVIALVAHRIRQRRAGKA